LQISSYWFIPLKLFRLESRLPSMLFRDLSPGLLRPPPESFLEFAFWCREGGRASVEDEGGLLRFVRDVRS